MPEPETMVTVIHNGEFRTNDPIVAQLVERKGLTDVDDIFMYINSDEFKFDESDLYDQQDEEEN